MSNQLLSQQRLDQPAAKEATTAESQANERQGRDWREAEDEDEEEEEEADEKTRRRSGHVDSTDYHLQGWHL